LYLTIVSGRSWPWMMSGRTLFFDGMAARVAEAEARRSVEARKTLTTAPGSRN